MAPPPVLYNSFAFTTTHLPLQPAAPEAAALAGAESPSPYIHPAAANIAAAAGAEALCRIYSLPSLRMLRRISCQETKNAAIR